MRNTVDGDAAYPYLLMFFLMRFRSAIVMSRNHLRHVALVGFLGTSFFPITLEGQDAAIRRDLHPERVKLEAWARRADSEGLPAEATRVRSRLVDGDFKVGDRVIVTYEGLKTQGGDTLVVQSGKVLRLGEPLGDLDLRGVLRFELPDSVAHRVSKYFKSATVRVTPLLRLSVSGAVRLPGYYYARADTPLSDLITRTAGQDQTTDLGDVVVKRDEEVIWNSSDVRKAFREGGTLESLGLVTGDEITVGARAHPWPAILQYAVPIVSALVLSLLLRR